MKLTSQAEFWKEPKVARDTGGPVNHSLKHPAHNVARFPVNPTELEPCTPSIA
jgi:hypothetical protein